MPQLSCAKANEPAIFWPRTEFSPGRAEVTLAFLDILLGVMLAIVLVVLLAGIFVMAKGGETAKKYSNKFMRYRVAAQFGAVIIIVVILFVRGSGGG